MTSVDVTVKDGMTLWAGVDYAHPERAYLIGTSGQTISLDDTSDEYDQVIEYGGIEIQSFVLVPTGDFTADVTAGVHPLTVHFGNEMTGSAWWLAQFESENLGVMTWAWDFGDTGTSTSESPSHVYSDAGTYTVTLTATNTVGVDDEVGVVTKTDYIEVT